MSDTIKDKFTMLLSLIESLKNNIETKKETISNKTTDLDSALGNIENSLNSIKTSISGNIKSLESSNSIDPRKLKSKWAYLTSTSESLTVNGSGKILAVDSRYGSSTDTKYLNIVIDGKDITSNVLVARECLNLQYGTSTAYFTSTYCEPGLDSTTSYTSISLRPVVFGKSISVKPSRSNYVLTRIIYIED